MAKLWKARYGKAVLLLLVPIVLVALIALILLFCFPTLHTNVLKSNLNNEIIDQDYPDWSELDLDTNIHISLPNAWTLQTLQDAVQIVDASGEVIAIGMKKEHFTKDDTFAFLSEYYGNPVVSYQSEVLGAGNYGSLASAHLSHCRLENGEEREQIILYLPFHYEYEYRFYFFSAECGEEVEAIAWSMGYSEYK